MNILPAEQIAEAGDSRLCVRVCQRYNRRLLQDQTLSALSSDKQALVLLEKMVGDAGIEPATPPV
jgi:hypothetical protein